MNSLASSATHLLFAASELRKRVNMVHELLERHCEYGSPERRGGIR